MIAQCPKACEKVAKAFTDIGLDAEARKIEVPASGLRRLGRDGARRAEPDGARESAGRPARRVHRAVSCTSRWSPSSRAATELKAAGGIRVGAVDVAAFPAIAQQLSVKMLPSGAVLINGDWLEYQGARTADGIVAFGKQAKGEYTDDEKLVQGDRGEGRGGGSGRATRRRRRAFAWARRRRRTPRRRTPSRPTRSASPEEAAPPAAAEAAAAPAEAAAPRRRRRRRRWRRLTRLG